MMNYPVTYVLVAVALVVLALLVLDMLIGLWRAVRLPMPPPRDPTLHRDQWDDERRAHLADMQKPAAKFIAARRHERKQP